MILLAEQILNGLQYAALLFILSAGLTLVFGVLDVINLAHGSLYMVGAFSAAWVTTQTGSFAAGLLAALLASAMAALLMERLVIAHLYRRGHLDQVLATFGITLIANEGVSIVFGRTPPFVDTPGFLAGSIPILPGLDYPLIRLSFIAVGAAVAASLWLLVTRTRFGMLIRAAADDAETVDALGVDSRRIFMAVFALAGLLCGLAGVVAAPLVAVQVGMGDSILIATFVVIVVGGVGSIRGSLVGALLVGMTDAFGRAYLPTLLGGILPDAAAGTIIPALVSGLVFLLMIAVLLIRPRGIAA